MWLTGRLAPDHKILANFLTRAQFVELCRRIGVCPASTPMGQIRLIE
jgi:hypothetical protein